MHEERSHVIGMQRRIRPEAQAGQEDDGEEDEADPAHQASVAGRDGWLESGGLLLTTDYIADETLTLLRLRLGLQAAEAWWRQVEGSSRLRWEFIDLPRADKARGLFFRYRDKDFSFTDCTSFTIMRELKIREVLTWMKSKDSVPIDATINKSYMPQLQMFNVKIISLINQNVADMRTILPKYENCFASFIDGNPSELTNFLRSARQVYYVLGYCISSLNSAIAIFFREIRPPTRLRISFEETNRLYIRLDTTLSRKRDVPPSL